MHQQKYLIRINYSKLHWFYKKNEWDIGGAYITPLFFLFF
ncbi:hypothetical protein PRV_01000 [Mycoplasma parvum str. Indiana]|uniref:Uncharacterized protein n=1 Tax=Mycoplasma parvum str. Indiana TaxID=1403316 RepID=U5NCC5_9MOLU|nr:hypothetical protein PRV_01000 [Mycoplasma parvum str. Indiana]